MRSRTSAVVIAAVVTIMALVFAFTVSYSYDHNGMPKHAVDSRTDCSLHVYSHAPPPVVSSCSLELPDLQSCLCRPSAFSVDACLPCSHRGRQGTPGVCQLRCHLLAAACGGLTRGPWTAHRNQHNEDNQQNEESAKLN